MCAFVREEPLDDLLVRKWNEEAPHDLGEGSGRLCLLSGNIAERNLKRTVTERGVPASQAAAYGTVDDIAEALLATRHGRPPTIVDGRLRRRALESLFESVESAATPTDEYPEALVELVERITWDDDAYDTFSSELDRYFRATDAGAAVDHEALSQVASELGDEFAVARSREGLAAYDAVHQALKRQSSLPDHVYLSRSHLVRAAREHVSNWAEAYPGVDWVGVATINVFDNPVVRLLQAVEAESDVDLVFFLEAGAKEEILARFDAVGLDYRPKKGHSPVESDAATDALDIAGNDFGRKRPADSVSLVEAPDKRREVEYVTERLRELLEDGVHPREILLIARDAGAYRPLFEDVLTNNGLPYHIETRRPMANLPSYRFLKNSIDLVETAATRPDEAVPYTALTDPLRLGFCLMDDVETPWPVPQAAYLRLEEQLAASQDRDGERTVSEWADLAAAEGDRPDANIEWDLLYSFLQWVIEAAKIDLTEGRSLRKFVDKLLQNHIAQTSDTAVRSPGGPMVDPSRTDLSSAHRSHLAERVAGQTGRMATYFDHAIEFYDATPGWSLAAQALGDTIGEQTFGPRTGDANAIRVVDAGNAYFRSAEHVFALGLSAGEFPRDLEDPTFVYETLRERVHEYATGVRGFEGASAGPDAEITADEVEAATPYLFYNSRRQQYAQELDFYGVATRACTGDLTLSHEYLNAETDPVAWSSFVDFLAPDYQNDEFVHRIPVDQWLPAPPDGDDDFWARLTPRDRLRSLTFHTAAVEHDTGPERLPGHDLVSLALWTDGDVVTRAIEPRLHRLTDETLGIHLEPDDQSFVGGLGIDDVLGGPVQPHEADLFGQCQLKFYYYQLLFNRTGDSVRRKTVPPRYEDDPTSRFGRLPAAVRDHYARPSDRRPIASVVREYDREGLFGEFADVGDLVAWWEDEYPDAPRALVQGLIREFNLYEAETEAGISREWVWRDAEDVVAEVSGRQFALGPHRLDRVSFPDQESKIVPVFLVDGVDTATEAIKQCWAPAGEGGDTRAEDCERLCGSCDYKPTGNCARPSKYVLDHRLHGASAAYSGSDTALGGVLFVEPRNSRPGGRQGYVIEPDDPDAVGMPDVFEPSVKRLAEKDWQRRADSWDFDLEGHLGDMDPTNGLTFAVDRSFVETGTNQYGEYDGSGHDGCATCAYQDLCQLPRKVNER
jgi:hypothetical protein